MIAIRTEEWLSIPFLPAYSVSNMGRVKRVAKGKNARPGEIRKLYYRNGYSIFTRKGKSWRVARIVVQAFIGEIPSGMQVHHKNGIRSDDRVENLEIVTPKENSIDMGKRTRAASFGGKRMAKMFPSQHTLALHFSEPSEACDRISGEHWKAIDRCPNYSVSSLGRIMRNKTGQNSTGGKILSLSPDACGYLSVSLYVGSNSGTGSKTVAVHREVARAFLFRAPGKNHVNHKNGIKRDNRLENLEYVTERENTEHAIAIGLRVRCPMASGQVPGEENPASKLKEHEVLEILASTLSVIKTAKMYGIHRNYVYKIKSGQVWSYLHRREDSNCQRPTPVST